MSDLFVKGNHWLEPILPSPDFPADVRETAETLPFLAGKLTGQVAPETARRLGSIMRLTNSYYSNLIEGQYTEPAEMGQRLKRREAKELGMLAITHIQAQEVLERWLGMYADQITWADMFEVPVVQTVHERLFAGAKEEELKVAEGRYMVPGQMRDAAQQNVSVGHHDAPAWESVTPMLNRLKEVYGRTTGLTPRLLAALAYHHRLAYVHPFEDGNGRLIRMMTHLQLAKLGLASPLWSISRGLAREQDRYYALLKAADQPRRGALDGRGQLTQAGLIDFVRFMLGVCLDQIQYTTDALAFPKLRSRLGSVVHYEPRFSQAGIKPEPAARVLHLLISQGEVARIDIKAYFGLHERMATDQLKKLIMLGVIDSPTPKSRTVYPAFPVWFAQLVFPDLHRRFN